MLCYKRGFILVEMSACLNEHYSEENQLIFLDVYLFTKNAKIMIFLLLLLVETCSVACSLLCSCNCAPEST